MSEASHASQRKLHYEAQILVQSGYNHITSRVYLAAYVHPPYVTVLGL